MGNTTLTKDEIARRGHEIYQRDIRTEVERDHDGRFLVVDVSTGRYEITNDELTAFDGPRRILTVHFSCCAWAAVPPTASAAGC